MNNLIAISGLAGSGKSTAAVALQIVMGTKEVTEQAPGWRKTVPIYEIRPFAAKLKQILSLLTGIPASELEKQEVKASHLPEEWWFYQYNGLRLAKPTYRDALQLIGTDLLRNQFHEDVWVNALFSDWTPKSKWIIPDLRFPNEFEAIKSRGGTTIRITRSKDTSGEMYKHESEKALEGFIFDHYIINDGTKEELMEKVKNII